VSIELEDQKIIYASFDDGMVEKIVCFNKDFVSDVIVIRILDTYKGLQYDDTCISEISLYNDGKKIEFDFTEELNWDENKYWNSEIIDDFPINYVTRYSGPEGLNIQNYFYSDGTFVTNFREMGTWIRYIGIWEKIDKNTIKIHYEYEDGFEITNKENYLASGQRYRDYEYYQKKIDDESEIKIDEYWKNLYDRDKENIFRVITVHDDYLKDRNYLKSMENWKLDMMNSYDFHKRIDKTD
jgi:hypothetical protein